MQIKGLNYLLPAGVSVESISPTYDPRLPIKRWKDPQQAGKSQVPYMFLNFDENGAGDVARDAQGRPEYFIGYIPGNQAAVANIPPAGTVAGNQTEIPIPRRALNANEDIQRTLAGFQVWITEPGEAQPLTPDETNKAIARIQDGVAEIKGIVDEILLIVKSKGA